MRIACFLPNLAGGGAERTLISVTNGLRRRGWEIDLVVGTAEGPAQAWIAPEVNCWDLQAPRVRQAIWPLADYLRRVQPQALLTGMLHGNLAAVLARALSGTQVPLLLSEHNSRQRVRASLWDRCLAALRPLAYQRAQAVIAVSEGLKKELAQALGWAEQRITYCPNPVDLERLQAEAAYPPRHPWLVPDGPPVILGMGRLVPQKDFATLIAAFAQVHAVFPQARLLILGEGPERAALQGLCARLGLSEAVDLPGFVSHPGAYLARAAVFVLSSLWEGFANVIVEALACGTPVVATRCPHGPAEILADGRYGRLVPPADPEGLAIAILDTLKTPPDAQRRAILQRRARDFALPTILDRYESLLELAIQCRTRGYVVMY